MSTMAIVRQPTPIQLGRVRPYVLEITGENDSYTAIKHLTMHPTTLGGAIASLPLAAAATPFHVPGVLLAALGVPATRLAEVCDQSPVLALRIIAMVGLAFLHLLLVPLRLTQLVVEWPGRLLLMAREAWIDAASPGPAIVRQNKPSPILEEMKALSVTNPSRYGELVAAMQRAKVQVAQRFSSVEELERVLAANQPLDPRPVALLLFTRDDYNGAFAHASVQMYESVGYRVVYREASSQGEASRVAADVRRSVGAPLSLLVAGGHGVQAALNFGATGTDQSRLDTYDADALGTLTSVLASDGQVILIACSTAEGGASAHNLATALASRRPGIEVFAPIAPSNLAGLSHVSTHGRGRRMPRITEVLSTNDSPWLRLVRHREE